MTRSLTGAGVPSGVFDTSDYPESERERMFVHVYSLAVMVEILSRPVHCRIELYELPQISLRVVKTSAQRSIRLAETIRMDRRDFMGVILLRKGSISGDLDGRPCRIAAGEALIADFGRPSSLEHSDHELITIGLERPFVVQRLPWLEPLNGTAVAAETAQPLFSHMDDLLARMRAMPARQAEIEAHKLVELLAAVLPRPGEAPISRRRLADDLQSFDRAAAYIEANLASSDLTPKSIWKAANVSRSRLYRLFAPMGGVSKYIIQQRLLCAREALAQPDDHRTIGRIAHDCGFSNVAHFARAFRDAFGVTAKQMRNSVEHRAQREAPKAHRAPKTEAA